MDKKNLIIGKNYLVKTKNFGFRKAKFKDVGYVREMDKDFCKFEEIEGLVWLIPYEEINTKVSELPF